MAIKYSGVGLSSLPLLNEHKPCFEHAELGSALVAVCEAAKEKGVRLLVDAEQASVQDGVHRWTLVCLSSARVAAVERGRRRGQSTPRL